MTISAPQHEYWQSELGAPSSAVTGFDDLHQGIKNVIDAQVGAIPGLPEFGCNHDLFRDLEHGNAVRQAALEIHDALDRWCERLDVVRVAIRALSDIHAAILVNYRIKGDVSRAIYSFEVNRNIGGFNAEL